MCKGGAWKGESVWHCSDGETERATIDGAKAGRKKETESRSPSDSPGGLLKAPLRCHTAKPCQFVKGGDSRLFTLDRLAGLCYLEEDPFSLIPKSPWKISIMILAPKRKPSMNISENS